MSPEAILHTAMCQSVALLNSSPEVALTAAGRDVHDILRKALIEYADAYMDQPVSSDELKAISKKHRSHPHTGARHG